MSVFRPARQYLPASLVAAALAAVSAWCGMYWVWALPPALLFAAGAGALYFLGSRPPIELRDDDLRIGSVSLAWGEIQRVEQTGWTSPLVLRLTLNDDRCVRLLYPGDPDAAARLTRRIQRRIRDRASVSETGLLFEVPEGLPLLRPEDEAEIERLYQRLKASRGMDVSGSDE